MNLFVGMTRIRFCMTKALCLIAATLFLAAVSIAQPTPEPTPLPADDFQRPSAEKRFKRYVKNTIGPTAMLGVGIGAGFSTAFNEPEEWQRSGKGFGRRFASNFGKNVIRTTTMYGLDEAFRVDSNFYRSKKRDAGSKLKNAIASTFTARTPSGRRTVGVPRIAGTYAAHMIAAETWYPRRFDWKDGARSGTISLGVNSLVNVFREFVLK